MNTFPDAVRTDRFQKIADHYDLLNDVISFGLHRGWKRRLIRELLALRPNPIRCVLDLSAGTGDSAALFVDRVERTYALDPSREMIRAGRNKRSDSIVWIQGVAEELPLPPDRVDILSCTFGVRNFFDRKRAFSEWSRVLVSGGVAGVLEIHPPPKRWYRFGLNLYWSRLVPSLGAIFSRREAYEYLRDSARAFLTRRELREEICQVGLRPRLSVSMFAHGMVSMSIFQKPAT